MLLRLLVVLLLLEIQAVSPPMNERLEGCVEYQPREVSTDPRIVLENLSQGFLQPRTLDDDGMDLKLFPTLGRFLIPNEEGRSWPFLRASATSSGHLSTHVQLP